MLYKKVTYGIEPHGRALTSPPNRLRVRCSGLDGELRALVKKTPKLAQQAD
jgi:hypothetical protein